VDPVNFDELVNFLIKNQFKKKMYSYIIKTQSEKKTQAPEDIAEAIARTIDPYF